MTNIQKLTQKLYEQKRKVGLLGGAVKIQEFDETEHNISASINPQNWDIQVSVKKDFNPIQDKYQILYAEKKGIVDGLETMVMHVGALHEPAHWELPVGSGKGCPYDLYNHDKILEAVKQSIPSSKSHLADYITNAFEDMVINPRCKEFNKDFSGQVLFWDWEGLACEEQSKKKGYTPVYEAFVKLNLHLFGDIHDSKLLRRHFTRNKKVKNAVGNIVKDLNLNRNIQDTSIFFENYIIPNTNIRVFKNWPKMASIFAKYMSELFDEQPPQERLSAYSNPSSGAQGEKKPASGNGIERKMGTKEGNEQIAYGRYSSGEKPSINLTSYDNLDSLYRKLAKNIPVKVETMTKEQNLQLSPLTYRAFDNEKDDITRIKPSKLVLSAEGNSLTFAYPNEYLTINSRSKVQRKSFPDFKMVMIDNSGSMASGINSSDAGSKISIPWGDKSKYHYALLGFYGIENFLQQQGVAQYIQHGLSVFSSGTRYSEGNFMDLERVRKLALTPEFGNTNLDAGVLKKALEGKESFVLSLSDGEVGNWNSQKGDFKSLAEKNYFAHVQIGSESQFSNDLKSWGFPVFYVNSGQDLSKLMVDITKQTYNRFVRE
ncbi:MAG: hypothetical protein Q7S33_05845 [Nanoarchaeota archaeon]|nr:hypothetical protein [Nanoarchaeota archaeon]